MVGCEEYAETGESLSELLEATASVCCIGAARVSGYAPPRVSEGPAGVQQAVRLRHNVPQRPTRRYRRVMQGPEYQRVLKVKKS